MIWTQRSRCFSLFPKQSRHFRHEGIPHVRLPGVIVVEHLRCDLFTSRPDVDVSHVACLELDPRESGVLRIRGRVPENENLLMLNGKFIIKD